MRSRLRKHCRETLAVEDAFCAKAATRCGNRGRPEPESAADAPRFALAAGARGANHQAGNQSSLIPNRCDLGGCFADTGKGFV
jgi:hypothetical protein